MFRSVRLSRFTLGLIAILIVAGSLRFFSYHFSLPYVDHVDEPAYYLGGQEWRGLYDSNGYYAGIPPAYVALNAVVQPVLEASGRSGLAPTVEFLRLVSVVANLLTLIFIALTARLGGGDFAGLAAGATWGIAPLILENGVYALPDPFIYLFTAMALWLAVAALLHPARRYWVVSSVIAGLLAVLMKYPALPALLPGIVVSSVVIFRERRGWRWLAVEVALIAAIGLWLVFVYRVDFNNLQREGATVKSQGLSNVLDLNRVGHNIYQSIVPLNANVVLLILLLGLAAYVIATRRDIPYIRLSVVGLAAIVVAGFPWLASSYSQVTEGTIRYVIPATGAVCVIVGLAAEQMVSVLKSAAKIGLPNGQFQALLSGWAGPAVAALLVIFVWIPQVRADWKLVEQRRLPDRRVALREWVDEDLDAGTVIVDDSNHKTFNPFWGGIPYHHWVDWWISNDIMEHPLDEWVKQRGMSYAVLPRSEFEDMQSREDGQAYLAQMLHLRDFLAADQRGPEMVVYRLWRMQTETDLRFGESIRLIGYDTSSEAVKPGDTVTLRFYWDSISTPTDNYSLFIHLTPMDEYTVLAQADGAPAVTDRPTLSWTNPDETLISSPFNLALPSDLPAGDYRVQIGLYNYVTNQRLPIQYATGSDVGDAYPLLTLHISD